jgi:hypothetical protein
MLRQAHPYMQWNCSTALMLEGMMSHSRADCIEGFEMVKLTASDSMLKSNFASNWENWRQKQYGSFRGYMANNVLVKGNIISSRIDVDYCKMICTMDVLTKHRKKTV